MPIFPARLLLLALLLSPLAAPAQSSVADVRFDEAMVVCDNMAMYVVLAQKQLKMNMPQAVAIDMVADSMQRGLQGEGELKTGTIALARAIYADVYALPGKTDPVEAVLGRNCGSYRGYNLPRQQVEQHLAKSVKSAWDPLLRVPLCTKLAQSAANIATARDRGMTREKIMEAAGAGLRDDAFSLAQLPRMVGDAYDHRDAEVTFLYVYNLGRCKAAAERQDYPTLPALLPEYAKCKVATTAGNKGGMACLRQAFKVDPQG